MILFSSSIFFFLPSLDVCVGPYSISQQVFVSVLLLLSSVCWVFHTVLAILLLDFFFFCFDSTWLLQLPTWTFSVCHEFCFVCSVHVKPPLFNAVKVDLFQRQYARNTLNYITWWDVWSRPCWFEIYSILLILWCAAYLVVVKGSFTAGWLVVSCIFQRASAFCIFVYASVWCTTARQEIEKITVFLLVVTCIQTGVEFSTTLLPLQEKRMIIEVVFSSHCRDSVDWKVWTPSLFGPLWVWLFFRNHFFPSFLCYIFFCQFFSWSVYTNTWMILRKPFSFLFLFVLLLIFCTVYFFTAGHDDRGH